MNGYTLSRFYFDWAFEHPSENNPTMTALYFFIVEVNNRLGWKKEFNITPRECMEAIGISSYNTYKKNFDNLIKYGFLEIVKKSANQYQANIIALSKFDKADNKPPDRALDKALMEHDTKQSESTCDIHKTINKETINNNVSDKPKRFSPPTIDEIKNYCLERKSKVDADKFFDFYSSKGWMVGKNKMKDWKAAVRTWENSDKNKSYVHPIANYQTSKLDQDDRW